MLVVAVAAGTAGLALALCALARGWRPGWRPLVGAGLLAIAVLSLVPPVGSADPESYAAYGHIAATGHNPYRVSPADAYRRLGDRVAAAAEAPWRHTPSVYGPVATAEQLAAARIGHGSVRTTVAVLQWADALAVVLTGLLLLWAAPTERARGFVAVAWWCNPLVPLALVAGAHVDALVALGVVAAAALARLRAPWAALTAGVAVGLAAGVKLPALFVAVGLCWSLRRSPLRAALLAAGAAAVLVAGYLAAGSHALDQTRTAARYASRGTPWRWLASALDHSLGAPTSRTVLGAVAVAVTLALLALLLPRGADAGTDPGTLASVATAGLAGYLAYLLAAPYVLPWYDAPAWALLAAAGPALRTARVPYAGLLLAHTGVLSAAYLTRTVPLPGGAGPLVDTLRGGLAPVVGAAVLVVTVATAASWRSRRAAR